MTLLILNIGAAKSGETEDSIPERQVLQALSKAFGSAIGALSSYKVRRLQGESTFVISMHLSAGPELSITSILMGLCEELSQDCIAAYWGRTSIGESDVNYLVGPKAEDWGPFDPAQFLIEPLWYTDISAV